MNFIGIDLGWKSNGDTALAALNARGEVVASAYGREEGEIISFVESYSREGCMVGVDAPLVVTNYMGRRSCEKQLQELGVPSYPANRWWLLKAFGGVRGELLVSKLADIGFKLRDQLTPRAKTRAVMEVYPYATLKMLLDTLPVYKKGRKAEWFLGLDKLQGSLARLHPPLILDDFMPKPNAKSGLKELKKIADFFDAAVAAYTVYLYWLYGEARCAVLGNTEEGFILLPRRP
jgi:predicted RNase H-like nuclease